ncbi:tyrosine-type recombinase/integrase [Saccharospirillum salsuginis]|uniref:tyrosine-type recombinase/integrase n=1 Tax=Saccharospirillum salsuginis TaxID=418750 RepID=UPI003570C449
MPELLTRSEVRRILAACTHPESQVMMALAYECGLRGSEVVRLKVQDLDGERGWLRIEQGKGAKDRLVTVGPLCYPLNCRPSSNSDTLISRKPVKPA